MAGTSVVRCYQCMTCSLGCPVAFAIDDLPHQIVRMVQLGMAKRALSSSTIWRCAACETCVARCPNGVDVLGVMDALREMALTEKAEIGDPAVTAFNRTFLQNVRALGRQYDLGLILLLKLKTRDLFSDLTLGIRMFLKGKLKLLPHKIEDSKGIKAIFQKATGSQP